MATEENSFFVVVFNEVFKFMVFVCVPVSVLIVFYQCYFIQNESISKTQSMNSNPIVPELTSTTERQSKLISYSEPELVENLAVPDDSDKFFPSFYEWTPLSKSNDPSRKTTKRAQIMNVPNNEISNEVHKLSSKKSRKSLDHFRKRRSVWTSDLDYEDLMRIDRSPKSPKNAPKGDVDIKLKIGAYDHDISKNIDDSRHFHFYEKKLNPNGVVPDSQEYSDK